MQDFFNKIFYDPELKLYKNKKISTHGWQGDTLPCFIKKYRTKNHPEFKQEKNMLTTLMNIKKNNPSIDWFPELYWDNNEDILVLENVGYPINEKNLPVNYKAQILKIFKDFNDLKLYHSDLCYSSFQQHNFFKAECTVLKEKLYITDFGQAFFNVNISQNEQIKTNILDVFDFIYESKTVPALQVLEDTQCFGIVFHPSFELKNIKITLLDENGNILDYKGSWVEATNTFCIENVTLSRKINIVIYYKYNNIKRKIFEKEIKYKT